MPYVQKLDRDLLEKDIAALALRLQAMKSGPVQERFNIGLLNYAITSLILRAWPVTHYADIAAITGVLENVKQEFYRKKAGPWEDLKARANGDVY